MEMLKKSAYLFHLSLFCVVLVLLSTALSAAPLFTYKGYFYSSPDLRIHHQQRLFELKRDFYLLQKEILDDVLFADYLDELSLERGQTPEEIRMELLSVDTASNDEIKRFYNKHQAEIPYPLEEMKGEIIRHLYEIAQSERKQELLNRVKKRYRFKIEELPPVPPIYRFNKSNVPYKGAPEAEAEVDIVLFSDYQCAGCKEATEMLERVFPQYETRARLIYKNLPGDPSNSGIRDIARGASCAFHQGKYESYRKMAFARQQTVTSRTAYNIAKEIGLESDLFNSCIKSISATEMLDANQNEADLFHINELPALFINGKMLNFENLEEDFVRAVEAEF